MCELAQRRAMCLHPHRVDDRVGSATVGQATERLSYVFLLSYVDPLHSVAAGHLQALVDEVDSEYLGGTLMKRDAGRHLSDRTQAKDRDRPAVGDSRVLDRLPSRGQHVG